MLFEHRPHRHKTMNLNEVHDNSLSFGDRIADKVANGMGSISFILIQSIILAGWIIWNNMPFLPHFDPMPFILLNLCLSFQAGYAAPFILISQNRQASKDRLAAEHDYLINERNEEETREIMAHLGKQDEKIIEILEKALQILERLEARS